jgi:Na+-driven multidrug efflux pump
MRVGLMSVSTIILNNIAAQFSSSVLAGMSVVSRVMMFLFAAVLGFGQGFQPVAGFNWGARRYDRVLRAFSFASLAGVAGISFLSLIMGIFARDIMLIFSKTDAVLIAVGTLSIRLQALAMPIHGWVVIVNMCYAGLGQARGAAILSITRQGIFYIPMLFLLPQLFDAQGLAAAQAAADFLSLAVALPLAVKIIRHIRQRQLEDPLEGMAPHTQPAELPSELPSA